MKKLIVLSLILIMALGLAGCGKKQKSVPKAIVELKDIKEEQIIEGLDSTGRINAEFDVNLVARIDGYLQKKFFEEGSIVKKGDLLFQIEPNTYAARVNEATANLQSAQAAYTDARKNLVRAEQLVKDDYISKADYDNKLALHDQNRATLAASKAALTQAQINYGYTKIYSPINGKIGKIFITEGNYVTPSSGTLATVVSLDPIFVDFSLKSSSYLKMKKASETEDLSDISVEITLADDTKYSQKGKIKFIDNIIDETSGTVQVRSVFENNQKLLVPGDFVQVQITLNTPKTVLMVPQESVLESEKGKYLYVIDDKKIAHKRDIEVSEEYKGNWVVTKGVEVGDKVAMTGLQYIQPEAEVILASEMRAQQAKNAEIKGGGKPSFFKKVCKKIKNALKNIKGNVNE